MQVCKTLLNGAEGYEGWETTTNYTTGTKRPNWVWAEGYSTRQISYYFILSKHVKHIEFFCSPNEGGSGNCFVPSQAWNQLGIDYPQAKWGLHLLHDGPRHPVMHEISQSVMDYPQGKWGLL